MSQRKPAAMTARKPASPTSAQQRRALENPIIQAILAKHSFFESTEFNRLVGVFAGVVKAEGGIDQEEVKYAKPDRFPFSAADLRNVFEAVMEYAPGDAEESETPAKFTVLSKTYQGLEFTALLGQGSSYTIRPAGEGPK